MGLVMEFTLYANYIPYTCARAGPATALPAECRAPAHEVGSPKMLGLNKSTVPNCGCHFMVICPVDMIKKIEKNMSLYNPSPCQNQGCTMSCHIFCCCPGQENGEEERRR